MAKRLTKWEGQDENGPRAVLIQREGFFPDRLQEALRKLARYEDMEDGLLRQCAHCPATTGGSDGEVHQEGTPDHRGGIQKEAGSDVHERG